MIRDHQIYEESLKSEKDPKQSANKQKRNQMMKETENNEKEKYSLPTPLPR